MTNVEREGMELGSLWKTRGDEHPGPLWRLVRSTETQIGVLRENDQGAVSWFQPADFLDLFERVEVIE